MNNRTVAAGVLAAVLIVAAWWMFLFSPARSDANKVESQVKAAKAKSLSLETEQKQLEDLSSELRRSKRTGTGCATRFRISRSSHLSSSRRTSWEPTRA